LEKVTQSSGHRKQLLASERAACFHCLAEFEPSLITQWCDEDKFGIGQTALCPLCEIDAVIGFSDALDSSWLADKHRMSFE
jgi:hypothetical protein